MIPPSGFTAQLFPLRHRVVYSFGLSMVTGTMNTALCTLVRHTNDIIVTGAKVPKMIVVNPKNPNYVEDAGAAVCNMSILDKLSLSIKFNMTHNCLPASLTSGTAGPNFDDGVYTGDGVSAVHLLWRPIFFSFGEKLDAADDDTGTTVKAILGLTKDDSFEDVVPLTTNKLPTAGASDFSQPVSTINIAEVFGDYDMTTDTTMEDHVWDEDLLQSALRRYSIKGALKSMIGRTRHLTLTTSRPYKNYYLDKFVPKSIRRVQPFTFMAIQVHVPLVSDLGQSYHATGLTAAKAHIGCQMIANYHEWNSGHFQDPEGVPPTSA